MDELAIELQSQLYLHWRDIIKSLKAPNRDQGTSLKHQSLNPMCYQLKI